MGYDALQFTVHVRLSRHNSTQDRLDDEALEQLKKSIQCLCECVPAYRDIQAHVGP